MCRGIQDEWYIMKFWGKSEMVDSKLYCQQIERVNQKLVRNGENPKKIKLLHGNLMCQDR